MALLAGLTGGMGSGKTTVGQILGDLGAYVIDADIITRSLVEPGQPALQEIVDLLGSGVLRDDHTLDREKIADRVFNNIGKKEALEAILHPRVFAEEQRRYNEIKQSDSSALVVLDAALLIESGNFRNVDKVIVVACDEETQIQRILAKKRFTRTDAERRLGQQMPLEEKIKFADYVIHNDSGYPELKQKVEALFHQLKKMAV